jgi:hypothetical protein
MPRKVSRARRQGIPDHIRVTLHKRLERHARDRWGEHCRAIRRSCLPGRLREPLRRRSTARLACI